MRKRTVSADLNFLPKFGFRLCERLIADKSETHLTDHVPRNHNVRLLVNSARQKCGLLGQLQLLIREKVKQQSYNATSAETQT